MLYIVATPIGNLQDITLRALDVLKTVDGIICEDSRRSSILLNHYQITKPLTVLNDYNESAQISSLIQRLLIGENLALVSDAGTPLISDPGFKLVRECLAEGIEVDSIPGPSSVITALTLAGLPTDRFLFIGYPPEKAGPRLKLFQNLCLHLRDVGVNLGTIIMLVSPYKLVKDLEDLLEVFGDIEVILAQELTKIHQNVEGKKLSDWLEQYKKTKPKGEIVLLLHPKG